MSGSSSFADAFDAKRNSLNAIRLALALLVIVSHAWPMSGFGEEPGFGGQSLGGWAVLGFFAISGVLITRSRLADRPARLFWEARIRRIMPGLIVALLVVAFVFAPIGAALQANAVWDPMSSVTYVLHNILVYPFRLNQSKIESTLLGFPYRDWDGPLWTLFWEACCYLAVGVGVTILGRGRRFGIAALLAAIGAVSVSGLHLAGFRVPETTERVAPFLAAFAAGAVLAVFGPKVPVCRWTVGGAAAVFVVGVISGTSAAVAPLPVTFLLLLVGMQPSLRQIGRRFDLSYGVYIYAWPIQQLVLLVLGFRVNPLLTIPLVTAITLLFAFSSCVLVERPALRRRGQVPNVVPAP